ncbi:hypothetical protein ONS96_004246 [Cadophora gregata f. sp. sojae]|nr:hypothetical protein ONS96_004246 [Cadophora gregata f. sp. sojae]
MAALLELPREMILHIAQFLSPASAATFTHCCHAVLHTLGTQYWQAIRNTNQRQELEKFLRLLEIDLSDHVLCSHCVVLHRIGGVKHKTEDCYASELFAGVYVYIHQNLTFIDMAAMMKLYRQGLDYNRFLERFTCKITGTRDNAPYQFSSQAKIINGSLLLRVQESLWYPHGDPIIVPMTARIAICHHVGIPGLSFDARLPDYAPCTLEHDHDHDHETQQCIQSTGTRQCVYCPTEFQIELRDCADSRS